MPARPEATEFPSFYAGYVGSVRDGDIRDIVREGKEELAATLGSIPESRGEYAYAEGKWSIKTVIGHMIDAERIFSYRALRISRGDKTPIEGFEQDDYVRNASFERRSVADLLAEFETVRRATVFLFRSLDAQAWSRRGIASQNEVTVRALAYIIAGHELHHMEVLRQKYLPALKASR